MNQRPTPEATELAKQCADFMFENDTASKALGMEIIDVDEGYAVMTMTIREDMLNGHQTCHGGMLFSLADSAFAFACNSQNHAAVAANCTIDFIRPARVNDVLTATAKAQHQGKRSGIYQITITNQENKLVALFKGNSARINQPVLVEN
ncbi:hydroxyphenylacetyl-CoA thioesterase PaaI [Paraneptunicella aestuarii]|uniref:hydroxyphenylacetyl-CoA thioesterase PaaI n=1 Tax=Paraneptunicella aestuarii TaxID=2831148 RepID=UPI001E5E956B|nr:hydroxyphenylacetyl-CoA thioesterase PaaI [Paraneptunicella aestuarii]